MFLKIVFKGEKKDGKFTPTTAAMNTKVYDADTGKEISGVRFIEISMLPGSIVEAKIGLPVSEIEMDGVLVND